MSLLPPPPQPQPHERHFAKPVSGSVSTIVNQYKSSVKRWCNKNNHEYFQWQPRFYDHIIRNEQSFETISEYILGNPVKWQEDK
jgi:putative transposase